MKTPQDFGAIGDGVTDDSVALQKWLDAIPYEGGRGEAAGRFLHRSQLFVHGRTEIVGQGGPRGFTLYCPATTHSKIANRNWVALGDENRIDRGITFRNVCFEGDAKAPIGDHVGCYDWLGVDGLTFDRCAFIGHRHFVIVPTNCRNVRLSDCAFDDWGVNTPYTGPPGGREAGTAIFGWQPNWGMAVERCVFTRGSGIAMWFDGGGRGLMVEDCVVDGASEAAIVGFPPDSLIRRNRWRHIRRHDVSGHGCEAQGEGWDYVDNESYDCDGAGHYFTDPRHCRIEGNLAELCNRGGSEYLAMSGAYIFRTATADPAAASTGVRFCCNEAVPGRDEHAVSFVNFSGNPASVITDFVAHDNDCGRPEDWRGGAIGLYGDPFGARPDAVKGLALQQHAAGRALSGILPS